MKYNKIFLVSLLFVSLLICSSIQTSAVTNYFRSDLSDLFNNAAFDYTKFNWTTNRGTSGFCGLNTDIFAETTYLRRTAGYSGLSGTYNCYVDEHTFSLFNFNNGSFKKYDIYIDKSSTVNIHVNPTYQPAEYIHGLMLYYNITPSCAGGVCVPVGITIPLIEYSNTTQARSVWRMNINTATQEIKTYNESGALNNTFDLSGYPRWYVGFRDHVHGISTTVGTVESKAYNFSVFETDIIFDEVGASYSNNVYETSSQTFTNSFIVNTNIVDSISSASFYYDDIAYSATISPIVGGIFTVTSTIDVPAVTANSTFDFYWTISYSDGSSQTVTTETHTQSVTDTSFGECGTSGFTIPYLNMTTFEEGTFIELNSSIDMFFTYYLGNGSTFDAGGYSNLNNNQSRHNLCFNAPSQSLKMDAAISYYYVSPITNVTYSARQHFLDSAILSNDTTLLNLYMLTENSSTLTVFTVVDQSYNPIPDSFVLAKRWNPILDTFTLVGMCKTDFAGKCGISIRHLTAWYEYSVVVNNNVVLETEPLIETQIERTLIVTLLPDSVYLKFNDIQYTFEFNSTTNVFDLTWTDTTGLAAQGCLKVIKASDNSVYDYFCTTSTSGSISSTVTENGTFIGQAIFVQTTSEGTYSTVVKQIIVTIGTPERFEKLGLSGLIPGLIIVGTLTLIGIASGSVIFAVMLLGAGVVVSYVIGFINIPFAAIMSLVAIVIIIAFLATRRGQ